MKLDTKLEICIHEPTETLAYSADAVFRHKGGRIIMTCRVRRHGEFTDYFMSIGRRHDKQDNIRHGRTIRDILRWLADGKYWDPDRARRDICRRGAEDVPGWQVEVG